MDLPRKQFFTLTRSLRQGEDHMHVAGGQQLAFPRLEPA
jgi:hypothetical protein